MRVPGAIERDVVLSLIWTYDIFAAEFYVDGRSH